MRDKNKVGNVRDRVVELPIPDCFEPEMIVAYGKITVNTYELETSIKWEKLSFSVVEKKC